jgi:hypothetical protein
MRTNLIEMLDDVNLPVHLGLDGSGELFGGAQQLVHTTSALRYAVFRHGVNFSGDPTRSTMLADLIRSLIKAMLSGMRLCCLVPLTCGFVRSACSRDAP